MSASSPVITIEVGNSGQSVDVRASIRRLYSKRVMWQVIGGVTMMLACVLAALCAIGFVDYGWRLPRAARLLFFSLVSLIALFFLARSVLALARRRSLVEVARKVEQAAGIRRNALVTFAESVEGKGAAESQPYMFARLERQARGELEGLDERSVAPRKAARRGSVALLFILLLIFALRLFAPQAFAREVRRVVWLEGDDALSGRLDSNAPLSANEASRVIMLDEVRVRVVPPSYSGLGAEEFSGDAPIRALSGSQIEVMLHASGPIDGASLSYKGATSQMRSLGAGRYSGAFTADLSGAFEARIQASEESAPPAPVVRAIEVYTDAPPEAHIAEPASDQLLRSVPVTPVKVRWTAKDDLGLGGAVLKYIKSRGEGDAAKFTNGELGTGSVTRTSGVEWQGVLMLDLRRFDMQPGDTLVFWLEARDRRPSQANNTGRSASLAIAIAGPEMARLNLSDLMPNEIGRFLLSQRAIIILTEKLHNERGRLSKEELSKRSNDIAAEQREFKNSFNDYIHVEGADEEVSGEASSVEEQVRASEDERTSPHFHGIPEPPTSAPTAVKEMTYAIRAMWDAEEALVNADTTQALKYEREALVRLKRAQATTRYVPPIVAQSKPVDLKRRYAGELEEIRTRLEKLTKRPQSNASQALGGALAETYAALDDLQETLGTASEQVRTSAMVRARERVRRAADRLVTVSGGDHAATIASVAGQLRVIEMELARMASGGTSDEFAARVAKPLALLTQAASNLFAVAEGNTRANSNDANQLLPTDEARAAEYFRRLAGGR